MFGVRQRCRVSHLHKFTWFNVIKHTAHEARMHTHCTLLSLAYHSHRTRYFSLRVTHSRSLLSMEHFLIRIYTTEHHIRSHKNDAPLNCTRWKFSIQLYSLFTFSVQFYAIFPIDFRTNYEKYLEYSRENDDGAPYVFFVSHLTVVCCSVLMKKTSTSSRDIARVKNSGMEWARPSMPSSGIEEDGNEMTACSAVCVCVNWMDCVLYNTHRCTAYRETESQEFTIEHWNLTFQYIQKVHCAVSHAGAMRATEKNTQRHAKEKYFDCLYDKMHANVG